MARRIETSTARVSRILLSSLRPPAVRALLLQLFSLFLIFFLSAVIEIRFAANVPLLVLALAQGVLAATLSRWIGLAVWWWLIQFLFPIALIAVLMLDLPPGIFLAAFVVLLALYWTTFRTQVPFFPSDPAIRDTVASLLPQERSIRLIDVGSGLGDLVMELAERRPDSIFVGIELAPLPWFVSALRAHRRGTRARFIRGDYTTMNFGHYDVVFAYLSPAAMPGLWEQARTQMRPGTLLLSYEFTIPDVIADVTLPSGAGSALLHAWYMQGTAQE